MFSSARLRRPSGTTVLAGLLLAVATGGVAAATIPGGDGALTACVARDGTVRVIDAEAGRTCAASQATIRLASLDGTGRVRDADRLDGRDSTDFLGATAKAADADTLDGNDSTTFPKLPITSADRHGETVLVQPGDTGGVSVHCPPGKFVILGATHANEREPHIRMNGPLSRDPDGALVGWRAEAHNSSTTRAMELTATVYCK